MLHVLKGPCHAFPVITLVCYVGFSACKRSAKSQPLKVHPVASKTLTQKIPVSVAPERLVGDFSFSICFFREPSDVTTTPWTNPRTSSHTHTHTQSFLSCSSGFLSLSTHTNSQPVCGCVCVSGWVSLSRKRPLGSQGGGRKELQQAV